MLLASLWLGLLLLRFALPLPFCSPVLDRTCSIHFLSYHHHPGIYCFLNSRYTSYSLDQTLRSHQLDVLCIFMTLSDPSLYLLTLPLSLSSFGSDLLLYTSLQATIKVTLILKVNLRWAVSLSRHLDDHKQSKWLTWLTLSYLSTLERR